VVRERYNFAKPVLAIVILVWLFHIVAKIQTSHYVKKQLCFFFFCWKIVYKIVLESTSIFECVCVVLLQG